MTDALAPVTYTTDAGTKLTITPKDVKSLFTHGNGNVTDAETAMFLHRCKTLRLDPFSTDVSLVKFGSSPASIIVGKDAFLKRADQCQEYDGIEFGVTVRTDTGLERRAGSLVDAGESLVGGWARVYRKDRSHPVYSEVALNEYTTGKSSWLKMPATMIAKVAKSQALREAFPNVLCGTYEPEEMAGGGAIDAEAVVEDTRLDEARAAVGDAMRRAKAAGIMPGAIKTHARETYGREIDEMNEYELGKLLADIESMMAPTPEAEPIEAEYYEEEVEF